MFESPEEQAAAASAISAAIVQGVNTTLGVLAFGRLSVDAVIEILIRALAEVTVSQEAKLDLIVNRLEKLVGDLRLAKARAALMPNGIPEGLIGGLGGPGFAPTKGRKGG